MNKICDNCETAIHCAKYGCIPERIGKPAQQETSNESAYQRGYLDGMAKPCVECADRKLKEMAKHPSVQQEADLSGLKPATQEVIKGWIEDGTFIERAIGAMQEQEAENMRLEKALAEQPAQKTCLVANELCKHGSWCSEVYCQEHCRFVEQPAQQQEPVAWVHWLHGPVRLFLNKDEAQMELERFNREYPVDAGSRKMRPLVFGDTPLPAQRKPLTDAQINAFFEGMEPNNGFWLSFARAIEAAHGIKENT